MSPAQAAAYLGLGSRWAIYRLIERGQFPEMKLAGAWAPEMPPLPTNVLRLRRMAPEAIRLFAYGRKMGWTSRQIVDDLNALGFRTSSGSKFTFVNAYQLYQHLKADTSLTSLLPSEPLPATQGKPNRGRGRCRHLAGTKSPPREQHSEYAS
jgi:hypothetical protein